MIGKLYGYDFTFDDGVTPVECSPLIDSLVWLDTYDEDLGIYRRTLDTSFAFQGADYDYLLALDEDGCGEIDLLIEYKDAEVYRGIIRFGTQNVDVDLEACIITLTIDPQDEYTCLDEEGDIEVNLIQGVQRVVANALAGEIELSTICTDDYDTFVEAFNAGPLDDCLPSSSTGWALINWKIEEVQIGEFLFVFRSTAQWAQEQATADCDGTTPVPPPGSGWVLLDNNCGLDGTADWGRPPAVTFDAVNSVEDPPNEFWHQIWIVNGVQDGQPTEYKAGIPLGAALQQHAPCELDIVSDFFNISPDQTAPANSEYAAAAAELTNVLVFQKSDVRRPDAVTAATRAEITYKALLTLLAQQFDVEVRATPTVLRIEHRSYWERGNGLDLTEDRFKSQAEAGLGYTYTNERLARRERWLFAEETSQAFRGRPIEYSGGCLPFDVQEEETYLMARTNNDMNFITANPDKIAEDGFVFAAAASFDGGTVIITSESADNGEPLFNAPMSIPNLLDKYHRRNRMLIEGRLNGADVTFVSAVRRKEPRDVTIKLPRAEYHDDFNPDDIITTVLGGAEVQTASYDAVDCTLSLTMRV